MPPFSCATALVDRTATPTQSAALARPSFLSLSLEALATTLHQGVTEVEELLSRSSASQGRIRTAVPRLRPEHYFLAASGGLLSSSPESSPSSVSKSLASRKLRYTDAKRT